MKLNILNAFPKELLEVDVSQVHEILGGPTLIHLNGKGEDTLFLSTLLHANEITSFLMLQRFIKRYEKKELPRNLIIFIGNTFAAAEGMRHLPGQMDYNRIWEEGPNAENKMALDIIDYVKDYNLFASIDVHNNTGKNPHYGCINSLDRPFHDLASHFGSHTVYFTEPHNVQSMAFSKICPSITVEAGLPGEEEGIVASLNLVEKIFNTKELSRNPARDSFDIYHTIARMKIDHQARVDFFNDSESEADISLIPDIDEHNFEFVEKQTHFGFIKNQNLLRVIADDGSDITSDFFEMTDGKITSKRLFVPSMFTKDVYVMKEDCLGYVMEVISSNY